MLCSLCAEATVKVKLQKGNTKNMLNHLKRHHPQKYQQCRPLTKVTKPSPSCSATTSTAGSKQQTLSGMFASKIKYGKTHGKQKTITRDIAIFLCETMTPIHIVDQPSFRRLLHRLDPRYDCPSRNHFSYKEIPTLYNEVRETLLQDLHQVQSFALTMDAWSSITTAPFLVITVHYVDDKFNLNSRCLQCVYVPEDHTGINIASRVEEVIEDFGLKKESIVSITTDSGSNMVVALRELHIIRLSCFGHVLHNAIGSAVKDARISRTLGMCRKIVSAFSFSFKKARAFKSIQEQLKIDQKKLKSDVATRWGSMFKMAESIQKNHKAIQQMFSQGILFEGSVSVFIVRSTVHTHRMSFSNLATEYQ